MGLITDILEIIEGRVHFVVFVGKLPAAEIELKDKEIIVEIKNPLLAMELGIKEFLEKRDKDLGLFKKIKKMGYKIRIKYSVFEFEI
jgi:hypothetical protein